MKNNEDNNAKYIASLTGKEIPILTLDPKWKLLFGAAGMPVHIESIAYELDKLVEKRRKSREKIMSLKRMKKDLLDDIIKLRSIPYTEQAEEMINRHTLHISEANANIEQLEDAELELRKSIYDTNLKLMLETMDFCYKYMAENTESIGSINKWIKDLRIELKKQLIRKQEAELDNFNIYTYMHQIFGVEVIELFDLKYDPERWHPVPDPESEYTES